MRYCPQKSILIFAIGRLPFHFVFYTTQVVPGVSHKIIKTMLRLENAGPHLRLPLEGVAHMRRARLCLQVLLVVVFSSLVQSLRCKLHDTFTAAGPPGRTELPASWTWTWVPTKNPLKTENLDLARAFTSPTLHYCIRITQVLNQEEIQN